MLQCDDRTVGHEGRTYNQKWRSWTFLICKWVAQGKSLPMRVVALAKTRSSKIQMCVSNLRPSGSQIELANHNYMTSLTTP